MSVLPFGPMSPATADDSGGDLAPRAFTMTYSPAAGWHKPQLLPPEQFALHPGAAGLHNDQIAREGLRAYRRVDGTVAAFRPWEHARRFRTSARRSSMPALPDDLFVSAVEELVEAEEGSFDETPGSSLYLRSLLFAADLSLGLFPARHYGFVLMARNDHPGTQAHARQQASIDRLDGANLFVVRPTQPRAEVTLLEQEDEALRGVATESVLTLASRLGYIVRQQRVTPDQWRAAHAHSELAGFIETFTCSTIEGVVPIGEGEIGPVTGAIRQALRDIHCGREPGPRGWMYQIPSPEPS
ncbi:MAG TPA: hypothetical protein VFA06_06055 [Actinocrinis sp.]|uniref:hypothetical protein n=1 Tax=Actinocrinis sp. TaxID=1920516 RepID=UPI002D564FE8|nr:hypothetical protein [Actinocrinis sp.]HZU55412.1 hypothetical protein [Actinocrinis sp.]